MCLWILYFCEVVLTLVVVMCFFVTRYSKTLDCVRSFFLKYLIRYPGRFVSKLFHDGFLVGGVVVEVRQSAEHADPADFLSGVRRRKGNIRRRRMR